MTSKLTWWAIGLLVVASVVRRLRQRRRVVAPLAPLRDIGVPQDDAVAVVVAGPGGYDEMSLQRRTTATACAHMQIAEIPPEECVTVRTVAAGVNYADVCVRWGVYESSKRYVGWPIVPGFEFSGTVTHVGARARGLRVGDEVFGVTMFGGYSSHVTVPASQVYPVPAALSWKEAAAFPTVALTAWAALDMCRLPRGHGVILVHSAAGGVGGMLCQLGKLYGHRVVGVVGSSHKVEYCESLGCDVVIDKGSSDLWKEARRAAPQGFDAVFDANGAESFRKSYELLASPGKLVVYGFHTLLPKKGGRLGVREWTTMVQKYVRSPRFDPFHMVTSNRSVLAFNLSFLFGRGDLLATAMEELLLAVEEGHLRVPKVTAYPASEVRNAHAALESGKTTGKLVLLFDEREPTRR